MGFIFNNSYGKSYRITGNETHKEVLIEASRSLIKRFNPAVGCIQSWDVDRGWQSTRGWKFPVIVDNMMNLEMLFEAAKLTGEDQFYKIAVSHADVTIKNHFKNLFYQYRTTYKLLVLVIFKNVRMESCNGAVLTTAVASVYRLPNHKRIP